MLDDAEVTLVFPFPYESLTYVRQLFLKLFFFLNDPATPKFSPLPLHAALPISPGTAGRPTATSREPRPSRCRYRSSPDAESESWFRPRAPIPRMRSRGRTAGRSRAADRRAAADRKSTRLNSSHSQISYAVFCLK